MAGVFVTLTFNDLIGRSVTSTVSTLTIPAWNPHKTTAAHRQVEMIRALMESAVAFSIGIDWPISASKVFINDVTQI